MTEQQLIDKRDRVRRQVNRRYNVSKATSMPDVIRDLVDAASCQLEDLECQDDLSDGEKYTLWALEHALDQLRWPVRHLWVEHNVRYVVGGKVEARFDPSIQLMTPAHGIGDENLWHWDGKTEMQENEMRFERGVDGEHGMPDPIRGIINVPVVYDRCFMVTRMQNEEIMDMFQNYHVSHMEDVRHDQ